MRWIHPFRWMRGKKLLGIPISVIALVFAGSAAAAAGWAIYTGLSGSFSGSFGTDTPTVSAITMTGSVTVPPEPGQVGKAAFTWTNNNPSATETINYPLTQPFVITTNDDGAPDNCKSHLSLTNMNPPTPASMTAGQVLNITADLTADATTPIGCKGKAITITVAGTTTP